MFLSPDPIGVAGGMNQYGYGLGDPVNSTDRSGLASQVCIKVPAGTPGCGTNPSCTNPSPNVECWSTNGSFLDNTSVTAYVQPLEPLVKPGPSIGIPSASPYPTGPSGGSGRTDLGGGSDLTRNAGFLMDFLLGTGRTERKYKDDDPQTLDMKTSPGADFLRDSFFDGGCQNMPRIGYSTPRAAYETIVRQNVLSTAAQVGGFVGSVTNNGNGTATYQIDNQAGRNSFVLHLPWVNNVEADPSGAPTPMRTIDQQFKWTEPSTFAGCR